METEFNWFTELDKAIANEPTIYGRRFMLQKAMKWPTCACGQLCNELPRDMYGAPADADLKILGNEFYLAITNGIWYWAKSILIRIEERTIELLTKEND